MSLNEDIGRVCKYLFLKDPFSALFLQTLQKEEDTSIPLAAVSYNKVTFEIKLLINPNEWNKYSLEQKITVLQHEEMHLTLFHFHNMKPIHKLDNIAGDIEINQYLSNLPEWAINYDDYVKQYPQLEWKQKAGKNYYYDLLNSLPEEEKIKMGISDKAIHIWDLPKEIQDYIKDNIESLIKDVASTIPGKIPKRIEDLIKNFKQPKPIFDYTKYIRNFITQSTKYQIKRTRSIENPRIETEPKILLRPKQKVLVLQDQSGSVSNEGLKVFNNEIYHLSKKMDVDVFSFDTEIGEKIKFSKDFSSATRNKSGGTDIQCCLDFYSSHNEYQSCIIYSDGHFTPRASISKSYLIVIDQAGTVNNCKNHRNVIKIPS